MTTETSIIVRSDATHSVAFTEEANALKEAALNAGAMVGKVTNAEQQEAAVVAQKELQRILSLAEKARKACKEPVLMFGRRIDETARVFCQELSDEMLRISTLVGTFQQQELARQRAEEQARNKQLLELEREKAAQLAKAKTEAEVDAVQEHFNNKAAVMAPPPAEPVRVEGQRVVNDWEIVVSDVHTLYRFHPNCVKLEPRLSEIKELLKQGVTPKGVTATPIVKAGVRVAPQRQAIEV